MKTQALILGTVLLMGGCTNSPFGGSGVYYQFSNTKDEGCKITIRKNGEDQSLGTGNVIISSKNDSCSVAGGISAAELTGKDSEFTQVISSIVDTMLKARGL